MTKRAMVYRVRWGAGFGGWELPLLELQDSARMAWWARIAFALARWAVRIADRGAWLAVLCIVLAWAAPALALDAPAVPAPVSGPAPASVSIVAGGAVSMGGGADSSLQPLAVIVVDLPASSAAMGPRLLTDFQLRALPGEALSLSDPTTFRSFSFRSVVTQQLSRSLRFSIYAGVGFASRLGTDPEPADRMARWWSAGLRFAGARGLLELGAGQDERLGGGGYWPAAHARGALLLASPRGVNTYLLGEAILALRLGYAPERADVVTLGVAAGR